MDSVQPVEYLSSHAEFKSGPAIPACHEENTEVRSVLIRSWILKLCTKIIQFIFICLYFKVLHVSRTRFQINGPT
jgi:hypothetical protein